MLGTLEWIAVTAEAGGDDGADIFNLVLDNGFVLDIDFIDDGPVRGRGAEAGGGPASGRLLDSSTHEEIRPGTRVRVRGRHRIKDLRAAAGAGNDDDGGDGGGRRGGGGRQRRRLGAQPQGFSVSMGAAAQGHGVGPGSGGGKRRCLGRRAHRVARQVQLRRSCA